LEIIEKYISQKFEIPEFTIEHILPDSENDENAHIGNLIPLESRLNARCGNKPLAEKYVIYSDSEFAMARGFSQRYKDKDFSIASRTEFLCKMVYNNILELTQFDYSED
ncbi:MAG: HNH endonuclease, partial [Lachnospiraceae bacterium]|nr:HNH endonuclease [Lachnospiraceae bacterium]